MKSAIISLIALALLTFIAGVSIPVNSQTAYSVRTSPTYLAALSLCSILNTKNFEL